MVLQKMVLSTQAWLIICCNGTVFIFLFPKKQCLFRSIIYLPVLRFILQDISFDSLYIIRKYTVDTRTNLLKVDYWTD